jgi:hypothetical protein
MVQNKESCRAADRDAPRSSPLVWFAMAAVAAAMLASLAVAAAKSGGLDRLLPKDQPFVPYFTT